MKIKRILYLFLGCLCLGLGGLGIALPILPTVPFFLVTVYCFARSSQRLHQWFMGTIMYKNHLESFVKKKGMTLKTKLTIMCSATIMMGIGFILMGGVPVGRIILSVIWAGHLIYFIFGVKTLKASDNKSIKTEAAELL